MDEKKDSNNFMIQLATFIVNKRKAFLVFFGLACIYCVLSISKVGVNNDLTKYLPDDTETRQGLDIMDEEFKTFGSATILVANVTYDRALSMAKDMEKIDGVSQVKFYDAEDEDGTYDDDDISDYYKDSAALFTFTFDDVEEDETVQKAIAQVREYLTPYDASVYTTVDKDDAASLREDMKLILVIVLAIIIGVLLFTSNTYAEIPIFLTVFGVAAVLNMGTNFWFGTISFITNAVGTVLQLALAIDYAIILCHRFMEEKEHMETVDAMITALSKAIPEISSSSLTTVSGMVALMLMQFQIGMDMGRVLTKAIVLSLVTVFLLMPALMVMCAKWIEKTRHKNFVPKITAWGKIVLHTRFILPPIFLVVLIFGCIYSNRCHYIYDVNSIESKKMNEFMASKQRIQETFETTNTMAVVVPKGDYQKEGKILAAMDCVPEVKGTLGLANVTVGDNGEYTLVDALRPRGFAEVADVDIDTVRALYQYYALEKKAYGAFFGSIDDYAVPIIDMIDFLYDQKENGTFNLSDDISDNIDDVHQQIADAREQLEGEEYNRLVFTLKGPVEGEETYAAVDKVRKIALSYYDEAYVVGDPTSNYDLSSSFSNDNMKISILTALFVGIILLFTFQSAGLPFMLVLTIQGSIWINFSVPYLTGGTMFFLSYLIVSSIQMGATIDYAIVITSRYLALRKSMDDKKDAIVETLNQSFPTIFTSGTILTSAGFIIGHLTSNATIASLGKTLGRGTLISIILVMTVLPQILLIGDFLIEKTAFTIKGKNDETSPKQEFTNKRVAVDGFVRGYISGNVNAKIIGIIDGDVNANIRNAVVVEDEVQEETTQTETSGQRVETDQTKKKEGLADENDK